MGLSEISSRLSYDALRITWSVWQRSYGDPSSSYKYPLPLVSVTPGVSSPQNSSRTPGCRGCLITNAELISTPPAISFRKTIFLPLAYATVSPSLIKAIAMTLGNKMIEQVGSSTLPCDERFSSCNLTPLRIDSAFIGLVLVLLSSTIPANDAVITSY
nr:hypothetical protein Iba_chr11dCG12320 [Ipomoea batatas]